MERLSQTIDHFREHTGAWLHVVFVLGTLLFLFFVALGGLSHNEKWNIEQVDISGTNAVSEDSVRALVLQKLVGNYYLVYARSNSYLFPKKEIEDEILNFFPRVARVSVMRVDDHVIAVNVTERKPYALWCGESFHPESSSYPDCWFVDTAGFVFDRAPMFSPGVYMEVYSPLVGGGDTSPLRGVLPDGQFTVANNFAKLLLGNVGKPAQLEVKSDDDLSITIQSSVQFPFLAGVVIRFNTQSDPAVLLKNMLAAIPVQFPDNTTGKKKLLYIDMRFSNKVIFGFE